MSTEMLPLFWRIATSEQTGLQAVSLLMPAPAAGLEPAEFPTEVSFQSNRSGKLPVDLKWSDEDSDLFMSLLDRIVEAEEENDSEVVLDINDGVVQGIVQLVALARFNAPRSTDALLRDDLIVVHEEVDIGDLVALNTVGGFVLAIVVGLDSIDATCVTLEAINDEDDNVLLTDHSLVVVNRVSLLPSLFADSESGDSEVRH